MPLPPSDLSWTMLAAILALAYLLGSIPFGLVLVRVFRGIDIRTRGSGNIGATNAWRISGPVPGMLTFLLDSGKGALAMLALPYVHSDPRLPYAVGIAAIIGHIFPVWLGFRGGKGVATSLAVLLMWNPLYGLVFGGVWAAFYAFFRYVSLASLAGMAGCMAYALYGWHSPWDVGSVLAIGSLVMARHASNIRRLLSGTEL